MLHGAGAKRLFRDLWREIGDDHVSNGAAAIGYFLTLAMFPALILMLTVVPYLPIHRVDQAIMDLLRQVLPAKAGGLVSQIVHSVTARRHGGLLSISALATLWAASSGMYAIMQQLNVTYDVKEERSFVRARALAVALSILFGVLVLGALSLVVLGGVIQDWIGSHWGFSGPLLMFFAALRWVIIIAALLLGFALTYKLGPNAKQDFKFLSIGSALGVVLLIAASLAFALYTGHFDTYNATYGSLGAVVILMLWLYIAGFVLLVGAEVNALVEQYAGEPAGDAKRRATRRRGLSALWPARAHRPY